jgi:nicotinamidase/pyrazinamidase
MSSPRNQPLILRSPSSTDVLIVIDMQLDFLPGGALPVRDGDTILPGIHALAARFEHVLLTQDWHPRGHISFASTHGLRPFADTIEASYGTQQLWPDHCIQGTPGAALHPALDIPHAELILRKGFRRNIDSYSAFTENDRSTTTGLAAYLHARGFTRLFFTGLAYDFCVGFSAIAAANLGFESFVIEDLCRSVNLPASNGSSGSIDSINAAFAASGVNRISSTEDI